MVTAEEIIAFGRAFDPQPMHTDPEAAKATPVGGLCASGWHTCAIMMRMLADGLLGRVASLGSPGMDEVRWRRPVRPGDVLSARYTVQEKRVLASRPDVGIAKVLVELVDANGEVPATWLTNQLTRVRHPAAAPPPPAGHPRRGEGRRSPACGTAPAAAAAPTPASRTASSARRIDLGSHTFTREEIVAFARAVRPAAVPSRRGGGQGLAVRRPVRLGLAHGRALHPRHHRHARRRPTPRPWPRALRLATYGPSPGFRDLKWPKPVYVGDTVSYRMRLIEKIDLQSRPNRGLLASAVQGRNQKGEIVFAVTSLILADRGVRPCGSDPGE